MSDLKACPFCGRIPDIEDCGENRWFIRCKCGIAQDKLFFQKCDAVRAWNKREELRVKGTNVPITDTISRQLAIELVDWYQHEFCECDYAFGELANELSKLPYAEPEITDEQAIEHLQSTGWMQNHDREMYDMGLKKQLADDSGSYDSLLPSAQPEIIRCKDCRYYKTYQYVNGIRKFLPKCSFNNIYVAEEDFCSQAERRTDEQTD